MDLAKQESVTVFGPQHFSVQVPALVAHVVITARSSCRLAGWHPQSETRTNSFFHRHRLGLPIRRQLSVRDAGRERRYASVHKEFLADVDPRVIMPKVFRH